MQTSNVQIANQTKGKLPSLPFDEIKNQVLGKTYELSIAFVGKKRSQALNKTYRGKTYAANILSFTLSKTSGEIVLCPLRIKEQAKDFGMTYRSFMGFLVIHGCLHLKGMAHGSTMERAEEKFKRVFGFSETKHL